MEKKHKFVVVGGGTAGVMAATYLKKYYGEHTECVLIYDHSKPGIGVGESLTPMFYNYLNYVGITREELVQNVNATVKLGLKFKNWLNDGDYYYHNFGHKFKNSIDQSSFDFNFQTLHAVKTDRFNGNISYGKEMLDNCLIPKDPTAIQSLHIDAVLFSRYVENKFKDDLTIVDGIVTDVQFEKNTDKQKIEHIVLNDGRKIYGDFFIDASGFQYVLFKKLNNKWIDKKDWLPLNRCIPNPVEYEFEEQPPYTTSEASTQGWILQVPLSNRWGAGYLYCDKFLSDEQAFENFEKFCLKQYGKKLSNTSRVIKFDSGFWQRQWVGNCIAVGLSSGFTEPLEATNIHHVVHQLQQFVHHYTFKVYEYDVEYYNQVMSEFYENVYTYLRFCYLTDRTDSEFWKYMTYNVPETVDNLREKIKHDPLNMVTYPTHIFGWNNFTIVSNGLKMIDKKSYENAATIRNVINKSERTFEFIENEKIEEFKQSINHKKFINSILRATNL